MRKTIVVIFTHLLLLWLSPLQAAISVDSARFWPAPEYTRLTLESKQVIQYNMFRLPNPDRLVIDLKNVKPGDALKALSNKISTDDPYIKSIRIAQHKPGVTRLVLDLKSEVKPQLFDLNPVGSYGHRLVLDIYPEKPIDPMMALLEAKQSDTQSSEVAPTQTNSLTTSDEKLNPTGKTEKAAPPKLQPRILIIAIDAGHGGEDPGAIGRKKSREKNVTLAIARKLKKLIDKEPNMRGVLIRNGDYFIPLRARVAKARKANADLFISIHADAFKKSNVRGSSVFTLSKNGASSATARWLAKKENEADLVGGVNIATQDPYLARTLLDLSQTATNSDSLKLADMVLNELGRINKLHRGHVEQAGFAVLKAPDIPSILVETAFITNPAEEKRLNNGKYQFKLSKALLKGIKRYFSQNPALSKPKLAFTN
jgi:N-acetylmuramoyl-L-alanine amidase